MTVEEQMDTLAKATAAAEEARLHYVHDGSMQEGGNGMKTEDEKRSSGVAKAGLTTGIIGTVLGALAGGNGLGVLGGGANGDVRSELAQIKAERYTDQSIIKERDRHIEWARQLASNDERLNAQDAKIEKLAEKNAADIAALRTEQSLQLQLAQKDSEIRSLKAAAELGSRIDAVANASSMGIQQNANALACLTNTVNQLAGMTKLIIPHSSICPPVMERYNSWTAPTGTAQAN